MAYLLKSLTACLLTLGLLSACVPQASAEGEVMTDTNTTASTDDTAATTGLAAADCPLDISLAETFNQMSSRIDETEAVYRVALRSSVNSLVTEVRRQVEQNGWQFTGSEKAERSNTTHEASYNCPQDDARLALSIHPIGRSSIYVIRLSLTSG